jgi:hypothetical protein
MALVLAACQGDTESSGGVSAKNLDGIWRRDPEYYLQFKNSDKTFSYHKIAGYLELKPYDLGKFATEGTQLLLTSGERSRACTAETGTYEVSFAEDGTLNLTIVSDPCEERAEELQAGPWKRFTD